MSDCEILKNRVMVDGVIALTIVYIGEPFPSERILLSQTTFFDTFCMVILDVRQFEELLDVAKTQRISVGRIVFRSDFAEGKGAECMERLIIAQNNRHTELICSEDRDGVGQAAIESIQNFFKI